MVFAENGESGLTELVSPAEEFQLLDWRGFYCS